MDSSCCANCVEPPRPQQWGPDLPFFWACRPCGPTGWLALLLTKAGDVETNPGFSCKQCDGTIQEANLAEDLVVDGETYGCVMSSCYLGDTSDGDGGVDISASTRIRNGWMKFRQLLPFLTSGAPPPLEMKCRVYASCVRNSMIYGSEARPLLADVVLKFERAEMQMIRWMCEVSMKDRKMSEELRKLIGVEPITTVIRSGRLRWYGHVMRTG